jgi:hypothetical protein
MLKYVLVALLFPLFSKVYATAVAEEEVEIPRKLVVPADGFNFEASARLQELLKKSEPAHICACIQATNVCALVYPFVPIQHIFSGIWHQIHHLLLRRLFLH